MNNTITHNIKELTLSHIRSKALADGKLIDVTKRAKEVGFSIPVAITDIAWRDCIEWNYKDSSNKQLEKDTEGRLLDVLYMLRPAITKTSNANCILFYFYIVLQNEKLDKPRLDKLKAILSCGDSSEPAITIMLPHEN